MTQTALPGFLSDVENSEPSRAPLHSQTRHGTLYGYQHRGCRCDPCVDAMVAYRRCAAVRAGANVRVMLPTTPLRPLILLAAMEVDTGSGGIAELGKRYAARFGLAAASGERMLDRILHEYDAVELGVADRVCSFLGLHLVLVYPLEAIEPDHELTAVAS